MRLAKTEEPPQHDIIREQTALGRRFREALGIRSARDLDMVEPSRVSHGRAFPGTFPHRSGGRATRKEKEGSRRR